MKLLPLHKHLGALIQHISCWMSWANFCPMKRRECTLCLLPDTNLFHETPHFLLYPEFYLLLNQCPSLVLLRKDVIYLDGILWEGIALSRPEGNGKAIIICGQIEVKLEGFFF